MKSGLTMFLIALLQGSALAAPPSKPAGAPSRPAPRSTIKQKLQTPATAPARSVDEFDTTSMTLVRELMREGRYYEAMETMRRISPERFRVPALKADYAWQTFICQVALGDEKRAVHALRSYLAVSEESREQLQIRIRALSPKLQYVFSKLP